MPRAIVSGCFVLMFLIAGCIVPVGSESELGVSHRSVIYDKDDRVYTDDHPNARLRALADAVAVSVSYSRVNVDDNTGEVTLDADELSTKIRKSSKYDQKPLCPSEPFRKDPAPGGCTVFLIGPDRIATAGHCIESDEKLSIQDAQYWCNRRAFVFRFKKGSKLTEDNVYRCRRVLVHGYSKTPKLDYAMFQLRRPVKGIAPLAYEPAPTLKKDDPLAIIGHPHGTYQKIAAGAVVYDPRETTKDYFITTLDTMPGNSGSPVFSLLSYKVVGIHVRGSTSYTVDTANDCNKSRVLTDGKGRQSENYMNLLAGSKCSADKDCPATHACEKGRCYYRTYELVYDQFKLSKGTGRIGDKLLLDVTVRNVGNADIPNDFRIGVWWSSNDNVCVTCGKDVELASDVVKGGLVVGATASKTFEITLKAPFVEGKQYIGTQIDDIKLATKAYSFYGDVAETNEDNNEQTVPFVVYPKCTPTCTQEGEKRCQGNGVETCTKNAEGCLLWSKSTSCAPGTECLSGKCVRTLKKSGEACASATECETGKCVPKEQGSTDYVCTDACRTNAECTNAARPFCQGGACRDIPAGACLTTKDCKEGEQCSSNQCVSSKPSEPTEPRDAGTTQPDSAPGQDTQQAQDNVPPTGCSGCHATRQKTPGTMWFLILFGLPLLMRKRRSSRL